MHKSFVFLVLLCVLAISAGQLLFKKAATAMSEAPGLGDWLFNGWLIGALALYAVTTIGWVWILRHVPLQLAYPFMGLAFLFVPLMAWFFLGERLHWQALVGGVLIMAGVTVASIS